MRERGKAGARSIVEYLAAHGRLFSGSRSVKQRVQHMQALEFDDSCAEAITELTVQRFLSCADEISGTPCEKRPPALPAGIHMRFELLCDRRQGGNFTHERGRADKRLAARAPPVAVGDERANRVRPEPRSRDAGRALGTSLHPGQVRSIARFETQRRFHDSYSLCGELNGRAFKQIPPGRRLRYSLPASRSATASAISIISAGSPRCSATLIPELLPIPPRSAKRSEGEK